MDIPRKLGIMIYTAVPAIVGGGIIFHFFGDWTQVIIYEGLLYMAALGIISR
ncbi:MAG: hypothetical protein MI802_01165 [Desulfobacterales bacterium]|nr:hypothetical protein [Desulfobacterales bacterium]